jgi:hypothetical protein
MSTKSTTTDASRLSDDDLRDFAEGGCTSCWVRTPLAPTMPPPRTSRCGLPMPSA